jgi:hypothetical protein
MAAQVHVGAPASRASSTWKKTSIRGAPEICSVRCASFPAPGAPIPLPSVPDPFFPPPRDWTEDLVAAGDGFLADLGASVDAADPEGRVEPRSRALCAALGLLGVSAYRALGGSARAAEVGRAGAMLSLLTKIDDQVIDALPFHGGTSTPRADLRRRTRAFLAPTLASIRAARPAGSEPRCAFAAALGEALIALGGDPARREHLLETIAAGWEVQVEAVSVLTSHPASVTRDEVASITRRISGAWLLMITMIGALPADADRPLSAPEESAFFAWGSVIQRADALADLDKDLADGHLSSFPGKLLWERAPDVYLDAVRRGDHRAIYALARDLGVDLECLAGAAEIRSLGRDLQGLGEVPGLLHWIYAYLARRYSGHPLSAPKAKMVSAPFSPEAPCSAR